MTIKFSCPACGHLTRVDDQFAGQSGPCAQCKQQVTIPTLGQAQTDGNYVAPGQTPQPIGEYRDQGSRNTCLIVAILAVVLGLPCLIALLLPAVQAAREAARRMQCTNNLTQLALGMHNYHDTWGVLPNSSLQGEEGPTQSWRVAVLPFLESSAIYDQFRFDEPWDSDHNLSVAAQVRPELFQCPSAVVQYKTIRGYEIPVSNYVMIVSRNPDKGSHRTNAEYTGQTMAPGPDGEYIGFREITDGLSNTLMIVEVTGDDAPAWCEPVDIEYDDFIHGVNIVGAGSRHPGGCNIAMGDGSVHFLSETIDQETLKRLANRRDGNPVDF